MGKGRKIYATISTKGRAEGGNKDEKGMKKGREARQRTIEGQLKKRSDRIPVGNIFLTASVGTTALRPSPLGLVKGASISGG